MRCYTKNSILPSCSHRLSPMPRPNLSARRSLQDSSRPYRPDAGRNDASASRKPDRMPDAKVPRNAPRAVRIIGGRWKRTPLPVVNGPGLRPTPDRVRETVFNWLTHHFGGGLAGLKVLDCFAGTGAMGFEAASRGADQVVLIESQQAAVRNLQAIQGKLKADRVEIRQADARLSLQSLQRAGARFDVIFLDPPYGEAWLPRVLPLAQALLAPGGCLYVEGEAPLTELLADHGALLEGLENFRADKAGQVFYHLLRCKKIENNTEKVPC